MVKDGTPPERVGVLNDQFNRALRLPHVANKVSELGGEVVGGTPDDFRAFMAAENKKWGELVESEHLQAKAE